MAQSLAIILPNTLASNSQEQGFLESVQQVTQAAVSYGPTSSYPTKNLYIGQQFFDTTLNQPVVWNGTSWGSVAGSTFTGGTWTGGTITGTIAGNPTFSGTVTVTGGITYSGNITTTPTGYIHTSGGLYVDNGYGIAFNGPTGFNGGIRPIDGLTSGLQYVPPNQSGGTYTIHEWCNNNVIAMASLNNAGTLTCVTLVQTSDENLKDNWTNLDSNFVEQLANLKSGNYNLIGAEKQYVGVGAQSLKKFLPNAVFANEKGELSVAYGSAALVSCVELAKENLKLKDRINILEEQMTKLISLMGA